jgi:glycosyltransferase involved in cell wall biosynthesis
MNNVEEADNQILALIPAFNEAARISPVIQGAAAHLPVLVVDDGSQDDTSLVASNAGALVIQQTPNQGKGRALRAGFRQALAEGYHAVLTLDADGQHDPAEIPKFLQAFSLHGADLIIGQRDFSQMPPTRRLANWLGRVTFSWALGQRIEDNQSGFRLVSRRLIEAILDSQEGGFEFEVEMIVVCVRRGYKLDWVPVRTIYAGESSHIDPTQHTRNFLRLVWQTRQSRQA